jgi:hypothetical protein
LHRNSTSAFQEKRGLEAMASAAPFNLRESEDGDERDRTVDPLLAKQVLSQLSYAPKTRQTQRLVGQGGFEPPTPRLSSVCSNQLSY